MEETIKNESLVKLDHKSHFYQINWNSNGSFDCPIEFTELIGFDIEELTSFPFMHHSLIPDVQGEVIHNSLINLNIDEYKKIDIELVSKDGKHLWFREFVQVKYSENETSFISTLFDISDFKNNEIELNEQIEKKEEINRSKDNLISIISHDLRAPFSSLLGFSEILLNEPNLPETERIEYLKYIYDASEIQLQMVNHLLDWTRLQTGTMKFEPQRIDIRDVIDNCVSVLTGSTIRKEIELKVIGNHGSFVTADERLIGQVVTNLLSNAVKFTPSGKKISVTIDLYKDNMVEVIIADEGVGIDEQHFDKLFKIDAKFTKSGTSGEKGSGFGLTLVKEIVEKHDGNIWFYSELDKGSEFHFTLPKAENTILVIEEHQDLQDVYSELVTKNYSNYNLQFCKNGFEALSSLNKKTPSILVSYHQMPLMNGIQLVSSLRKKDVHNKVSVIIICDGLSNNEKSSYNDLGVTSFLPINSATIDLENLLNKVTN